MKGKLGFLGNNIVKKWYIAGKFESYSLYLIHGRNVYDIFEKMHKDQLRFANKDLGNKCNIKMQTMNHRNIYCFIFANHRK